ncbi:hypothetical protein AVEN_190437-1, partial [Araneus ventricosus]
LTRFEETRGPFWDRLRNFEPLSDDENHTSAGTLFSRFRKPPTGGRLATTYYLRCNKPHSRRIFSRIGLPLGDHGLALE